MLIACVPVKAAKLLVPQQYATIQLAINAAAAHDTVLVSPGVYYENINFRAKGIVLASQYINDHDTATISATVINGSQPANPDSASCVIIASKLASTALDSSAAIIGFTITGGTGTKWDDEHAPGSVYREGGGILVQYLSPRILHNHITYNMATDLSGGMQSAGGGAIRCGDSNPLIQNNVIDNNQGRYGAGIVFNYCGGMIRNNLIAHNKGGQDFGGAGLWILGVNSQGSPRNITNNTIIYNYSSGPGGGIRAWNTTITITNNILWGNTASLGKQIFAGPPTITVLYNDIQDGYTGTGNISNDPQFDVQNYYLSSQSPCIDRGDSVSGFNDLPDPLNPSAALFPSKGNLRNDMGAYGGPYACFLSSLSTVWTGKGNELNMGPVPAILVSPNPLCNEAVVIIRQAGERKIQAVLFDLSGKRVQTYGPFTPVTGECSFRIERDRLSRGKYSLVLSSESKIIANASVLVN
jgi:hypothetical protein